jgi:hypothetical protein
MLECEYGYITTRLVLKKKLSKHSLANNNLVKRHQPNKTNKNRSLLQARWVRDNLGPTIKNSRFNNTLILTADEQRYLLHFYMLGVSRFIKIKNTYLSGRN